MIVVKNRVLLIPETERYIGTPYDNNSEIRTFQIERAGSNGVDLSALSFRLDLQYKSGKKDTALLTKEVTEEKIFLNWGITNSILQEPGTIYINIRATDTAGGVKWTSFQAAVYVEHDINTPGEQGNGLTELEQLEARLDKKMEQMDTWADSIDGQETERQKNEQVRQNQETERKKNEIEREKKTQEVINTFETAIGEAKDAAKLSESWAVGGTGTRDGEDGDNSKYYYKQSQAEADRAKQEADKAAAFSEIVPPVFRIEQETMELIQETAATGIKFSLTEEKELCIEFAKEEQGGKEDAAADHMQIWENKTNITTLTDKTNTLAPGIVLDAKGGAIAVSNASEQPFVGLNVYGKSTQVRTTGAQLYNPALWDALIERPDVKIVNHMDGSFEVSGSELTSALSYSHVYTHEETLDMFSVGDNVYLDANDTKTGIWFNIMFIKNGVNYSPKNGLTQEDLSDPTLRVKQVIFGNTGTKIIPGLVRPMLSKIKDADWEPYTGGKPSPSLEYQQDIVNAGDAGEINVSICGKNLLTGRKYYGEYTIGKAFIANLNDEVVLPYEPSHSTKGICYAIDCVAGKTYTFSVSNSNPNGTLRIAEYANLNDALNYRKVISYANATAENAFINYTAKGKGVIVCLIAGKWTESNNLTHNCTESELLQLELGSTATPYEPPKPAQTLTLSTPNGLAGIPVKSGGNYVDENGQQWITDEVDLEKGERVQRIGKHTFGDTDRFSYLYDEKYDLSRFSWLDYIEMAEIDTPVMYGKMRYVGTGATEENVIKGSSGFSRCYMYVNTSINTVEKFKEIIAGSEIIYVLSNPIRTPLTPEEIATYKSLHTYSGTTVVTNDSGAGMSLTYTVDTKKYVDEKIAAISAAMIGG